MQTRCLCGPSNRGAALSDTLIWHDPFWCRSYIPVVMSRVRHEGRDEYNAPGGKAADFLASFFEQDLRHQVAADLRGIKQIIEAGEIPTASGQPSGRV